MPCSIYKPFLRSRVLSCLEKAQGQSHRIAPEPYVFCNASLSGVCKWSGRFFIFPKNQLVPMLMVSGRVAPPSMTTWLPVR